MRKIYYVSIILIVLIVSFIGITYSFEYSNSGELSFELIGPSNLYLDVDTDYVEYGIKVYNNGIDISDKVKIDDSMIDTSKLGEYNVKYQIGDEYIYRKVIVIDKVSPVIKLNGGNEVYILLGGKYEEAGYVVTDNYDTNLDSQVNISGTVDTNTEGNYQLIYSVSDNSGNKTEVKRTVIVKKPVISVDRDRGSRVSHTSYNVYLYTNTIVKNNFTKDGVYLEGYTSDKASSYKIKLKNRNNKKLEYTYNMNVDKNNYYGGNLKLSTLNNGLYDLYIVGNKEERLLNKLDIYSKIVRAKVGNKLVTFTYDDDYVSINIEDFQYKYDFVIDPGHGGSDIGASNGLILEKDLNLKVSKYEKCRYESMGYKVYMIRYDDTYGEMLGNSGLDQLDRRGLTTGYYGAVSRVVYSNHHNGSLDTGEYGFEILVQNSMTKEELATELSLANKFRKFYGINDSKIRVYSKDYFTDQIFDKENGQVYDNKNYYSVLRIPYELFNVKNVIYEPIYMTNAGDFNWYYSSGNWIKVSELKIKEYVTSLGGTYKSDNSMCM